ncbi:hypothetical protein AB205_0037440 [Aquarana catesbeiana]|uniref:Uncharacterized protein n=1 Tax=Aquarana catesbeiana TaxID=8400 RepID=A0A2G9R6I2_AQUCT|nr:hypothetical protein AB205_0037440 [Aquarana catesbeiana]
MGEDSTVSIQEELGDPARWITIIMQSSKTALSVNDKPLELMGYQWFQQSCILVALLSGQEVMGNSLGTGSEVASSQGMKQ